MSKRVFYGMALITALMMCSMLFGPVIAQSSCPTFRFGLVPTAAQWQACFDAKQATLGYTPLNNAGGTMSGALVLSSSLVGTVQNVEMGADVSFDAFVVQDLDGGNLDGVVPTNGRIFTIIGPTSNTTVIRHENGGAAVENRFDLPGGTDITLDNDGTATFIYNPATTKWNLLAQSS